ncbi:tetratricopeptide repeat protein [Scopulibacillus cellulosilyticus]|uniref:Tetratricopeptide repeat protein n=1 Tax=Scopulibacillus cellulosilyticus TaxID=2665665 RepID=A0ABW2PWJ5_9BACL
MKRKHMARKIDNKLVLFPHLEERLVERGIDKLKSKKYKEAQDLFEQLHQIEPDHPQAAYGLSVCYVELGDYEKAESITSEMLKKDIGNYYDVLRLHMTILIQRRRYQEVITMAEVILEEDQTPPDVESMLQQLAEFCRIRLTETNKSDSIDSDIDKPIFKHDLSELHNPDPEKQWLAIQNINNGLSLDEKQELTDFLSSDTGDPFIKTLVLKLLKDKGAEGLVTLTKLGETFKVDLGEHDLFNESFKEQVSKKIQKALMSENPTLCELAQQIWQHFIVASFPKSLEPKIPEIWAGACCLYTHQINGMDIDHDRFYQLFDISLNQVKKQALFIKEVEELSSENNL